MLSGLKRNFDHTFHPDMVFGQLNVHLRQRLLHLASPIKDTHEARRAALFGIDAPVHDNCSCLFRR